MKVTFVPKSGFTAGLKSHFHVPLHQFDHYIPDAVKSAAAHLEAGEFIAVIWDDTDVWHYEVVVEPPADKTITVNHARGVSL